MALLQKGFSFRASTAFLALALGSLAFGLGTGWLGSRFALEKMGAVGAGTLMFAFPLLTLCSSLASLVYLVWRRRIQHLAEFAISAGLLVWLSTWEFS